MRCPRIHSAPTHSHGAVASAQAADRRRASHTTSALTSAT